MLSLTLHFCKKAIQNLWITHPLGTYFVIFSIFYTINRLFLYVKYYTPLRVLDKMLKKAVKAYLSEELFC